MFVSHKDVFEHALHTFSAEASSLGLKPGQVPSEIETDIGNGLPLVFNRVASTNEVFIYRQELGIVQLHILND
jgi:hypothetical protein